MTENDTKTNSLRFTKLTESNRKLNKRYTLDDSGKLSKQGARATFTHGKAEQVELTSVTEIPAFINLLSEHDAMMLGVYDKDVVTVVSKEKYEQLSTDAQGDTRTRSKAHVLEQTPGLVLFDYDVDEQNPYVLNEDELVFDVLGKVDPAFEEAALAVVGSASFGINGGCGLHIYAHSTRSLEEVNEIIKVRSWNAGFGWIKLAANGRKLERALFDHAVFSSERIIFEAPVSLPDGVERPERPMASYDGGLLNLAPLTDEEIENYKRLVEEAKAAIDEKAILVRSENARKKVAEFTKNNPEASDEERAALVEKLTRDSDTEELDENFILEAPNGEHVTVRQLIDRGREFNKRSMPDPIEGRDYGSDTAMFFASECGSTGYINSFAHGNTRYILPIIQRTQAERETAAKVLGVKGTESSVKLADDDPSGLINRYTFMQDSGQFYDHHTRIELAKQSLDMVYARTLTTDAGKPDAVNYFIKHPERTTAISKVWLPQPVGTEDYRLIRKPEGDYVNTYRPPAVKPVKGDCSEWKELCRHIYGEQYDNVMDHMAFTLQHPEKKILWGVMVFSTTRRQGKSLTFLPLQQILGSACGTVTRDDFAKQWGDAFFEKKALLFEECVMGEDSYNDLKMYIVGSGDEQLNIKGKGQVTQRNLYSVYMCTNHPDRFRIEEGDNKLLVIEAPHALWGEERYRKLAEDIKGVMLPAIMYELMTRDVSRFNYSALPEITEATRTLLNESRSDYEAQIREDIEDGVAPFDRPYLRLDDVITHYQKPSFNFVTKPGRKLITRALHNAKFDMRKVQKKVDGEVVTLGRVWSSQDNWSAYKLTEHYDLYELQVKEGAEAVKKASKIVKFPDVKK